MNKKRFIIYLIITFTLFTIANWGIFKMNSEEKEIIATSEEKEIVANNEEKEIVTNNEKKEEKQDVLTFDEYQKFYDYLSENIKLKNYEKKYSSSHDVITIIDPLWTFNSRKKLLLTDEDIPLPTEEYLILENKNSTCQITISVCYNKHYIGNDLHSLTVTNADIKTINEELTVNTNSAVMSYNNILICIQVGRSKTEGQIMADVLTEISTKIMDYYK